MEAKIILTLKQEALEKIMKENNLTTAAELKGFLKGSYEYLDIKQRSGELYDINVETKLDYAEVIRNLADAMKKCSFTVGVDLAKPEVKEVKRPAKVGEWIKIVDAGLNWSEYENGSVLKVRKIKDYGKPGVWVNGVNIYIGEKEYVVLENYEPPKKPEVKEVKRQAKPGEYIKIVEAHSTDGMYKNGDIFQVNEIKNWVRTGVYVTAFKWPYIWDEEYVVLENYEPPKKPEVKEVTRKAEVGEWIKIVRARFTEGKYKNGDILKVRALKNYGICTGVYVENIAAPFIDHDEYVVLENYNPEDGENK